MQIMKRREFVAATTASALAAWLAQPLRAAAAASKNGIGLQLWTVRNQLAEDADATLQAVKDAGYVQVELMNVVDSQAIAKIAKDKGLELRSAFFNWETIANPSNASAPKIEQIIETAGGMGLEYLVFGYIGKQHRDTADKLKAIAERANAAAEKIQNAGMKMSYHNHAFEFETLEEQTTGFDILMQRFDPARINFELDVFWAAIGGWDPVETMHKLGKRLGQIHLKDLKAGTGIIYDEGKVPADAFQELGDGEIDMQQVIEVAQTHGVTQFHVEQDESPDPIQSIAQSVRHLKTIW